MEGYEQRVIAFVDVRGWSDACREPSKYSDLLSATKDLAHHAGSFSPETKSILANSGVSAESVARHGSIEFSFFSDSFAISAPIVEVEALLRIVARACTNLLERGFACRGGVATGDVHHKAGIVFGPALVEAVEREKCANYPRLICGEELVELFGVTSRRERVLMRDDCGHLIVMVAISSAHELDALLIAVDKGQAAAPSNCWEKWNYLRKLLPQIFEATGGWKPCDQLP